MPKLVTRGPKYSRHKASGQAIVKVGGRVHYLGPHGSPESKTRFQEVVSKWQAEQATAGNVPAILPGTVTEATTTIVELIAD